MPYKYDSDNGVDKDYYSNLIKKDEKRIRGKSKIGYIPKKNKKKSTSKKDIFSSIMEGDTFKGLPSIVGETIKEANEMKVSGVVDAEQIALVFSKLFEEFNKQYGLNIYLDVNSFSKSLAHISNPKNKKALELFISEVYSSTRAILYLKYLDAIITISEKLFSPGFISSNTVTPPDMFIMIEKIFGFMEKMNLVHSEVNIPDAELKLENLVNVSDATLTINSPGVRDFLERLSKSIQQEKLEK
jgi:hypothetical protein